MAFRIKAAALAGLILWPAAAQEYRLPKGVLRVTADSIRFQEKDRAHEWSLGEIRRLTLGPSQLRLETYEGHNREYVFAPVPRELMERWYPVFSEKLDQRFVAALADERVAPEWRIPVKLVRFRRPVQGELLFAAGRLVFRASPEAESRTWRIRDIESVATAGPFDLAVTTREKEFRFDLKGALPEERYEQLWREVNRARGLKILP